MKNYFIIKGNDEGEEIEPYLINSEEHDLDYHLICIGDCSRSYEPVTADQAIEFLQRELKKDRGYLYYLKTKDGIYIDIKENQYPVIVDSKEQAKPISGILAQSFISKSDNLVKEVYLP